MNGQVAVIVVVIVPYQVVMTIVYKCEQVESYRSIAIKMDIYESYSSDPIYGLINP
jgi:hypothetical protein